jgi:hypothetical protein
MAVASYVDEAGAASGKAVDEVLSVAVGGHPKAKRGWQ